jgi:hypothetical protein
MIGIAQTFAENTATSTAASVAVTATGTTAGNTLVVFPMVGSLASVTGIAGGTNGAYTVLGSVADTVTFNYTLYAAYKANIAGSSDVITASFSFTTGAYALLVAEIGDVAVSPSDGFIAPAAAQQAPGTGANGITTGSGAGSTNAVQPALIVGCAWHFGTLVAGTGFAGTNFAAPATFSGNFNLEHKRIVTTSAKAATWTALDNGTSVGMGIMLILDELAPTGSIGLYETLNGGISGLSGGIRS